MRAELVFSALKSARPDENRVKVDAFLAPFDILAFDQNAADRCAQAMRAFTF